ncbi:DUF305 domain-containing protein [Sphaerisporangium sp. NPDC004334]
MLASGLASTITACTSRSPRTGEPVVGGTGAPVIVPGAPGDRGRTAEPGERVGTAGRGPSAADVRFAERMVPHHRQALEMADLAPSRAAGPGVRRLAGRISAGQRPEIDVMTRWLRALGRQAADGHDGHDGHGASPGPDAYGMASLEEMNRLRASRGAAFDALFLRLMIRHHEGALKMAGEELAGGADQIMRKMAQDMASGQRVEIGRMRALMR